MKYALNHSASRTIAALLGSIPVALALAVSLTLTLPLPGPVRLVLGWYSVLPLWLALSCCAFLARSGARAWLGLFALAALAGLVIALALGHTPASALEQSTAR